MTEATRVNDHGSDHTLSLFECCLCHSSKHDPVLLNCLHYYCQSCFELSYSKSHAFGLTVTCPACSEVTEIRTVLTNSFLSTYKRLFALRAEIALCNWCARNTKEETAEFWCAVCEDSLCAACFVRHNKFECNSHRIFEVEHARTLPLRHLTQTVRCNLHHRAMETHCFTCCLPKCSECMESCSAGNHDLHLLSDMVTQEHMSSASNRVRDSVKRLVRLLPGILQKCRAIASRLHADRTNGHRMLLRHRRHLQDSTLRALENSAGDMCLDRRNARFEPPGVLARGIPLNCVANIEMLALTGIRSLQLFGVKYLLNSMAGYCCMSGRSSIRRLRQRCEERGSISIHGSVPLTSDVVLSACLGKTDRRRASLRTPLLFRDPSVNFETPVACSDLAVTQDGHVLLAALEHGLLMYSDRGQQISSWRPARRSSGEDDGVSSVAMLSDGRAAVSVVHAQLVVLLRRSDMGDTWSEDRRVAVLQSPPRRLAVYDDLVAVTQCRPDALQQPQMWSPAREVELLRLSSGQVLYTYERDYEVQNIALTALCVITTSLDTLTRSSGTSAYVVDAFHHSGAFLWRYETSAEELVWGLCAPADTCWSRVYVTVWRRDRSSRVVAIGPAGGSDMTDVMDSSTHGLQLPAELSLARGQRRTILAVLNWVEEHEDLRTVSLYEASD